MINGPVVVISLFRGGPVKSGETKTCPHNLFFPKKASNVVNRLDHWIAGPWYRYDLREYFAGARWYLLQCSMGARSLASSIQPAHMGCFRALFSYITCQIIVPSYTQPQTLPHIPIITNQRCSSIDYANHHCFYCHNRGLVCAHSHRGTRQDFQ